MVIIIITWPFLPRSSFCMCGEVKSGKKRQNNLLFFAIISTLLLLLTVLSLWVDFTSFASWEEYYCNCQKKIKRSKKGPHLFSSFSMSLFVQVLLGIFLQWVKPNSKKNACLVPCVFPYPLRSCTIMFIVGK